MSKTYGMIALFDTAPAIFKAAEKTRDAGFQKWDVHSPFPVHGMDAAMGLKRSRVPAFTLAGGVVGFFSGMALAWYTGAFDYPLIVGGMPFFSPIFPFPVAYELTILLAAFGTLFGMFALNRLPQLYHPSMNCSKFDQLTDDRFAIVIEAADPRYDAAKTRAFLEEIGGREIEELSD